MNNCSRWTQEEHKLFLQGIMLYGKDWKSIQPLIKTRSLLQIRTHAQKVFKKVGLKKVETKTNISQNVINDNRTMQVSRSTHSLSSVLYFTK